LSSQIYTLSCFLLKKRVVLSCCCLAIGGGARPSIMTNAAAIYVRPKPPTYTHSYKSYVTSAYWAQFKVHNRNMKRGGKVKQVVAVRKTCNNKSCRATWAVFYILRGFVARYSLRYFNQYETKCIKCQFVGLFV
jgi:hypothetical protein